MIRLINVLKLFEVYRALSGKEQHLASRKGFALLDNLNIDGFTPVEIVVLYQALLSHVVCLRLSAVRVHFTAHMVVGDRSGGQMSVPELKIGEDRITLTDELYLPPIPGGDDTDRWAPFRFEITRPDNQADTELAIFGPGELPAKNFFPHMWDAWRTRQEKDRWVDDMSPKEGWSLTEDQVAGVRRYHHFC